MSESAESDREGNDTCPRCGGEGRIVLATTWESCKGCDGSGSVVLLTSSRECEQCGGNGLIAIETKSRKCWQCRGTGRFAPTITFDLSERYVRTYDEYGRLLSTALTYEADGDDSITSSDAG